MKRLLLALLAAAALAGCNSTPVTPIPSTDYQLPTFEITNGVVIVTFVNGVPAPAPDPLSNQLYSAGATLSHGSEWTFNVVDTPAKRAAIEAAILQGARFKKILQ